MSKSRADPVLVTTDEALQDEEFQQALRLHADLPLHLAVVNRQGRFRLLQRSAQGMKPLREAEMNLDELLAAPRGQVKLIDERRARKLPAIFSVEPFPLLLPHNIDPQRTWRVEGHGVLSIVSDLRLMLWKSAGYAARQLADNVPVGPRQWHSGLPADGKVRAVVGHLNGQPLHLLEIALDGSELRQVPLEIDAAPYHCVCSHNSVLFAIGRGHVDVVDSLTGSRIQRLELPGEMVWQRDRFFRRESTHQWYALSYDGRTALVEPVLGENAKHCPRLLTLFDRTGIDGPIGVTCKGDLYMTATDTLRRVTHGLSGEIDALPTFVADGSHVLLNEKDLSLNSDLCVLVDVDTLAVYRLPSPAVHGDHYFRDIAHPKSLRHKLLSISVDQRGILTLATRKGYNLAVDYDPASDRIRLRPSDALRNEQGRRVTFKPVDLADRAGYRLSVAAWEDGSRAFVDSRGLLHLKSAERSIPEVTIVLSRQPAFGLVRRRPPVGREVLYRRRAFGGAAGGVCPVDSSLCLVCVMIEIGLTLRYTDRALRPAEAWYVPGGRTARLAR